MCGFRVLSIAGQIFYAKLGKHELSSWAHGSDTPSVMLYQCKILDSRRGIAEIIGYHHDDIHHLIGTKYRIIMHYYSSTLGSFETKIIAGGEGCSRGVFQILT